MCAAWQPLSDRPVNNIKSQPASRRHSLVNDLFILELSWTSEDRKTAARCSRRRAKDKGRRCENHLTDYLI